MQILCVIAATAAFLAIPAAAKDSAPLLVRHRLPVAIAQAGIVAAVRSCEAAGYRVSAVVVDVDGGLQASMRGDGAGLQTVQSATDKAMTSAMYGVDSSVWVDRAAKGETISPLLNQLPHLLLAKGGVVIRAGQEVIGGIAIAGAPGGELDETCARAGLSVITKAIERP